MCVHWSTAIVGTPPQVVDEMLTQLRLGIDEFILSGFPHLEECIRVSQEVLPRLRAAIAQAEPRAERAKK